jgi:uncharacterized protein (TIGR00369 family)
MSEKMDNPDRKFIADAVAAGLTDVPIDTNPQFRGLSSRLIKGIPGDVTLSFIAGPDTEQGNGVVSGGAMATMLDSAMAMAVLSKIVKGQTCSSISLTINMMRPAQLGKLVVRATVDKLGRQVAFASATLMDEEGSKLFASAVSSLLIINIPPAA